MTTETTTTDLPSHYVYAVRKGSGRKSYWTRIGAAWPNRDGQGFSLKLELMPVGAADIVIRTPREEREGDDRQESAEA